MPVAWLSLDRDDNQAGRFLTYLIAALQIANNRIGEHLERANLFLVSLDDERKWYRYHHVFADLLRARLDQPNTGLSTRLHALAATLFETNNFYEEPIHHSVAARDYPKAARLVEAVAENA